MYRTLSGVLAACTCLHRCTCCVTTVIKCQLSLQGTHTAQQRQLSLLSGVTQRM